MERVASGQDPVADWLRKGKPSAQKKAPPPAPSSPRASAEEAIGEFQSLIFDLTFDQAREAYIRLLVGRGFQRPPESKSARVRYDFLLGKNVALDSGPK
jgi:hypothetical protein